MKDVACMYHHLKCLPLANRKCEVREFKNVIQEFCSEFEDPSVKTVEDIINFNLEHKNIALPERKISSLSQPRKSYPRMKQVIMTQTNDSFSARNSTRSRGQPRLTPHRRRS